MELSAYFTDLLSRTGCAALASGSALQRIVVRAVVASGVELFYISCTVGFERPDFRMGMVLLNHRECLMI
jgi:hypothetical protein